MAWCCVEDCASASRRTADPSWEALPRAKEGQGQGFFQAQMTTQTRPFGQTAGRTVVCQP